MKQIANPQRNSQRMSSAPVVVFTTFLLLFTETTPTKGQQQRFFLPSANSGSFALPSAQFQEDVDSAELVLPQRRLSSAEPSSSSFFSSQPQLPLGTFTNSGPFSRQPTAQQFILNGQQAQFQPVRSAGSLSFSDAVSAIQQPSFFQQPPSQRSQQQQPQSFNFFPGSSSQQQRFRPIVQQQQDSVENVDENLNSQSSLTAQQSSQERFPSETSRRPQQKSNGIISGVRNPSPIGSNGWWNPATLDGDQVAVNVNNNEQSAVEVSTKDATVEFNQQKRSRGQPPQGRRRPFSTSAPSSVETLDEQEPAAIGFTVIHDANDNRSSWSQPTITTHRPQLGQTPFRSRTSPAVISGSNRRPTTYNPLSVASISSTSMRPAPAQPTTSTATLNRLQPTTFRTRKPSLVSTVTTTVSTYEDELELEQQSDEDKQQLPLRTSTTTTLPSPIPVTTLRNQIKPRLNTPVASIPQQQQQQQRMKKVVNNPTIIQSITTRKPTVTSTRTLAPTTTTVKEEEYEDYEDIEYTTSAYTTSDQSSNKKQTKPFSVTQSSVEKINQKNNNSLSTTTESWVVVASVQTSRSVSSSLGSGTNQNLTTQNATTSPATTPTNKHRFNNKPTTVTTSTTTVESIIDKLDRVQSELSNGILYGSASNHNNSSRILTDIQNSGNSDDKRNDLIMSSFTTPTTQRKAEPKITTSTPSTTTTSTTSKTSPKEDDEDEEEEKEEDDSNDSNKETTFVRKFVPTKLRTSTVSNIVSTTTIKPSTQTGKKKSLIDSVKFDELLTSGLLPAGFNPKPPPAYKSKIISTTTTTETSLPVTNISVSSDSDIAVSTTPSSSTTTVKMKSGLKIKFVDDSSALASLLPPGFKLEESIKPVEILPPSLLPPGYKIPTGNDSKNKEPEEVSTTAVPPSEASITTAKETVSSTAGIVFPNSGKGTNSTGIRKPLPSSKKMQASVIVAPVIQKGWPVRATTEFTGWSTPSTTPLSIEKLLSQSKASDLAAAMTSTLEPTTSTTTTTTTTTMKPPPTTTPGQCSESDSVCELVGTVRIVGSGSEKWIPELLDHNTAEWRLLANEVESQLDKVYSKSPALSKWYKKITIDSFSPGNNGISTGKPDKNAGILVDFFVQLNQLGRTVSTADIRRLFHETLQKEGSLGSSAQPLQYGYGGDSDGLYLKLGRFTVDPARTDFIVLPKPTRGVTVTTGTEDAWLPQWAVAVMVIGLASLLFVLIFGITVLVSRHRNNKKIPPPTVQTMISGDHHKHMYGTGKNGPTVGSRHMMHHPPNHPNSNYNASSYGYDNYAIDDDMMILDDDDLEDVDRLYDMDAVWADDKHKAAPNSSTKKHRDTHYDSWRSTALSPQALTPAQTGYYPAGVGGYSYGADPGYSAERRHYHREPSSATNPRSSHHHYSSSYHNPNMSYTTTSPRKPPQQYHPDYDTDF